MPRKTKSVVDILKEGHKIVLNSWSCQGASACYFPKGSKREMIRGNCLAESVVVANGQHPTEWSVPKGRAKEAMEILGLLAAEELNGLGYVFEWDPADTLTTDTEGDFWAGAVGIYNDLPITDLEDASNLMADALAIAQAEERDALHAA